MDSRPFPDEVPDPDPPLNSLSGVLHEKRCVVFLCLILLILLPLLNSFLNIRPVTRKKSPARRGF